MTKKKNPGENTTFCVSCRAGLLDDFDVKLVDLIRAETKTNLTRSKLLKTMMVLLLDVKEQIDLSNVYDEITLQEQIKAAFKRKE